MDDSLSRKGGHGGTGAIKSANLILAKPKSAFLR